ncbi:ADP-ribose glycohydrolase MACROD2-like isoform X3 [Oscarella lobularis]|uniref:ADP-ribose glycohydrolase MACROD2-like isoform X3 n=1 Tax=Oscarella lobularis TaxID=121494 RepID=UPI00331432FB
MYSIRRFFSSDPKRKTAKYWAKLSLEDKRKQYSCGENYVTLDNLKTWQKYKTLKSLVARQKSLYEAKETLNEKVTLWKGDITCLEIDAIVNAANSSLLGGGGVDGCIHRAAGDSLLDECHTLDGCNTGKAKLTSGHRLPAKYVLHAVGPIGKTPKNEKLLRSCYSTCLELALEHKIRSLAFCCIATGIYGYPNKDAASVAIDTVRKWLDVPENAEKIDRIIFCTFLSADVKVYEALLPCYFPDAAESSVQYEEESATDATDSHKIGGDTDVNVKKKGRRDPDVPPLIRSVSAPVSAPVATRTCDKTSKLDESISKKKKTDEKEFDSCNEESGQIGESAPESEKRPKEEIQLEDSTAETSNMAKEATSFSDSAPESENRPEGDIQPDESATAETPNMAKEVTSFSDGALKSDEQRPEGEISAVAETLSVVKEAIPVSDSSVPEKEIQSSNETSNVVEKEKEEGSSRQSDADDGSQSKENEKMETNSEENTET